MSLICFSKFILLSKITPMFLEESVEITGKSPMLIELSGGIVWHGEQENQSCHCSA
jgi:hypothetical protein